MCPDRGGSHSYQLGNYQEAGARDSGPVGQSSPDTITTAVRLAPREHSHGGGMGRPGI
jgi:hypothetical protein